MAQQARIIDKKAVSSIMNKRQLVTDKHVGRTVRLTVQGNGTRMAVTNKAGEAVQSIVEEGTQFEKIIFNCKANSDLAMKNQLNRELLAAALTADKSGKPAMYTLNEKDGAKEYSASDLFSAYLNRVQLSFSVPTTARIAFDISAGVEISGKVDKITTERGSLLTIDPTTIRIMEPEELSTTTFAFEDDVEESAEPAAIGAEAALNDVAA